MRDPIANDADVLGGQRPPGQTVGRGFLQNGSRFSATPAPAPETAQPSCHSCLSLPRLCVLHMSHVVLRSSACVARLLFLFFSGNMRFLGDPPTARVGDRGVPTLFLRRNTQEPRLAPEYATELDTETRERIG